MGLYGRKAEKKAENPLTLRPMGKKRKMAIK
jgi:hypothetical protein